MSIRRITISVPAETAARIRKAAGRTPVSAWVTEVIEERLDDAELERLWQEFYQSVRPRRADARRADAIFKRLTKAPRRKSAA
jgi:hypothetical protein